MSDNQNNQNYLAKLNIITAVLRLGHESFQKDNLIETAYHILNNTRALIEYDRACLVDMRFEKPKIIAVSGQADIKQNSEYCIQMQKLLYHFVGNKELKLINQEQLKKDNDSKKILKDFQYFAKLNDNIILLPLVKPGNTVSENEYLFWIVEIFDKIDSNITNTLSLLSQHYRESVWYHLKVRNNFFTKIFKLNKNFTPLRVFIYLFIILIIISFFKISQNVSATFELIPSDESVIYAPFSGIINDVYYKNGQAVKAFETVLKYDTQELSYKLSDAQAFYDEITAQLDWVKQKSFLDKNQLGKVKILALKQHKEKIEIKRINWYLSQANIKAKISGTLILNESEKWSGKAVRAGDKLFEIVSSKKLLAEVMLNEADSAVINNKTKINLYLHSSPETPIHGKIISVSPKPMLTKTGQFCYIIKMQLIKINPNYIVGMRGVARVSGKKVSIGYYLFKNIVLWWRKI